MPPMPVEMLTLTPKPIDQTTEFVGTIKSRRSTTIQPQVEGFITRIAVKSGDRVSSGTLLVEIDSKPQEASISSLESVKAQREIDVTYARQESDRAKKLLDAGAASQMDFDRAANALKAAEAQVRTVEEQIRQLRTQLAYYKVTSPTAGVIGDIPVRQGDRVSTSTLLTTVEANEGLELYLNVPVQQGPQLRVGLPVRLIDETGKEVARAAINFVSPSVDAETQTILAKVPLNAGSFRTSQYVRAQVIWSSNPTLTVPVTAVLRINGQYFAFVAQSSPQPGGAGTAGGGGALSGAAASGGSQAGPTGETGGPGTTLTAKQRPVALGNVIGNDYVVLSGLNAGETLIVSGVQKIGDGAPVMQAPGAVTAPNARPEGRADAAAKPEGRAIDAGDSASAPGGASADKAADPGRRDK